MMPHMMPMQQPDVPALPNKILFLTQLPPETTQMMLAMLFNQYCSTCYFSSLNILPFIAINVFGWKNSVRKIKLCSTLQIPWFPRSSTRSGKIRHRFRGI